MNLMSRAVHTMGKKASDENPGAGYEGMLRKLALRPQDRVTVLGGYGVRNLGDEAILAGLLTELPSRAMVHVISRAPGDTAAAHGVRSVPSWRALALLARTDVLIVGGGGIFSGHMGRLSQLIPVLCLIARARGVRVAFHGVGVYPSTPWPVQRAIRLLAPHLASFTVRDRASFLLLRSWGFTVEQIPDLSTLMPAMEPESGAELLRSTGLRPGRPTVALCLTAADRRVEGRLLRVMPEVIEAMPEVQFCFVPMSQHPLAPRHNDLLLARRLAACAPRMSILTGWHHPAQVLSLFHHFAVVVCMRYHSMLFARRAGASVVPIPYAEKCDSWVEEYGVPAVDMTREDIVDRLEQELWPT